MSLRLNAVLETDTVAQTTTEMVLALAGQAFTCLNSFCHRDSDTTVLEAVRKPNRQILRKVWSNPERHRNVFGFSLLYYAAIESVGGIISARVQLIA